MRVMRKNMQLAGISILAVLSVVLGGLSSAPAQAANPASGFDAGNIINDSLFYDGNAMTASQVQSFLNQQVPTCWLGKRGYEVGKSVTWGGVKTKLASKCTRDYSAKTETRAANMHCSAYAGARSETAAQIVAKVGKACGISQRVLLITLQKEQSLITDPWPNNEQYARATGYACPDSGPGGTANCDVKEGGFFQQVYRAAWQLKVYKAFPNNYNYKPFQNNRIAWHPSASCGSSTVNIKNSATAALYIYTPYRPNQAALNAGWGTGDSCSSYGNRNFYNYYNSWFGGAKGFAVTGAALDTWNRFGGASGSLGVPVSDASYVSENGGGYLQNFTNGVIFTENSTGRSTAMSTRGAFYANFVAAGSVKGPWGWPTADAACGLIKGGCTMQFQKGVVAYSPKTGSHLVPNELLEEWSRLKGVAGTLGYPVGAAESSPSGIAQLFESGLSMTAGGAAYTYNAEVASAWKANGGLPAFGVTKAPVVRPGSDRYYIEFERAALFVVSGKSSVRFGSGAFYRDYLAAGAAQGAWGWPLAPGFCNARSVCTMNFDKGQAVYSPATGVAFLTSEYYSQWGANGGFGGSLGYPIGTLVSYTGGSLQKFQGGAIVVGPKATVRFGSGAFMREWEAAGAAQGAWGWPLSPGVCEPGGNCQMEFSGGRALYTASDGVKFARK